MSRPMPKNIKFHFTHPNHPLIYLSDDRDYFCDGCKTFGSNDRYRCQCCDFDLHEFCSNCPGKLSSFLHRHPLTLEFLRPQIGALGHRFCNICLDPVEGLVYRCKGCDFDAHPLCTQLPQELDQVLDNNNHSLNLQEVPFGICVVCGMDCSSLWVYGCNVCGLYIHFDCLLEPYEYESPVPPMSKTTSRGTSFAPPPPVPCGFSVPYTVHPGPPLGFHHVHFSNNCVNNPQASLYGYARPPPPPPPSSSSTSRGRNKLKKSMFSLVGRLALGVVSTSIFGTPLSF